MTQKIPQSWLEGINTPIVLVNNKTCKNYGENMLKAENYYPSHVVFQIP